MNTTRRTFMAGTFGLGLSYGLGGPLLAAPADAASRKIVLATGLETDAPFISGVGNCRVLRFSGDGRDFQSVIRQLSDHSDAQFLALVDHKAAPVIDELLREVGALVWLRDPLRRPEGQPMAAWARDAGMMMVSRGVPPAATRFGNTTNVAFGARI